MKFSTALLPLLTVTAKEKKIKTGERGAQHPRFEPSEFRDECSEIEMISASVERGTFEATGSGSLSGQIKLEKYGDGIKCKQVITAGDSCEAIEIRYTSISIEKGGGAEEEEEAVMPGGLGPLGS